MTDYKKLFQRNYAIFSDSEQEKIRQAHVLIVGCGGIGGTVAVILARSGVTHFTLVDFDSYSLSNTNRQISCFADTIGKNKAEIIKEDILRINPGATVKAYPALLSHSDIAELMYDVDVVFPAADDFAFSLFVFRDAKRLGKPALLVVPSGTWANVSLITPDSPSAEDIEGVPKLSSYEELRDTLERRQYKFGTYFYVPTADWRIDYYRAFIEEGLPPAQICPTVWLSSAIGAFEVLKYLSGKWQPVTSPRYWNITRGAIRINRINGLNLQTLLVWQRRFMWHAFQTPLGFLLEKLQSVWWKLWYSGMKLRENRPQSPANRGMKPNRASPDYRSLFLRNYGIFSEYEQERIRHTSIVIVGDSGAGEALATILARCGVGRLVIAGEDSYVPSDMNRQIGCFSDTIGKKKIDVIRDSARAINPEVEIITYDHLPAEAEMDEVVTMGDIIIPAVDDLAYSVLLFRAARRHGRPTVLCLPSGTAGWISVFTRESPTLEDMFGIPKLAYPDLITVMKTKEYRCAQYNYVTSGDWRVEWFYKYFTGRRPLALICPVEFLAASLAALETLKIATGKWSPLGAPHCWVLRKGKVRASRFSFFVRAHRKLGWAIFGSKNGTRLHRLTHFVWKKVFDYHRHREGQQNALTD